MPTLYEIDGNWSALEQLLIEAEGDISGIPGETLEQWLKELETDLSTKADGYAAMIQEILARAEARKAEADRLNHRAKVDFAAAERLTLWLKEVMVKHGVKKLKTLHFNISVCNNGGRTPIELTWPVEQIPAEYIRLQPIVKMDEVRDALEKGPLPFAKELPRGTYLRIS